MAEPACVPVGAWVDPGGRTTQTADRVMADIAGRQAVILAEYHDSHEHHRWQLQVLAALQTRPRPLVIGFETFPRSVQKALDRWVAGELSVAEFLNQSEWDRVWGMDPALYLRLFHFARMHRIPMVALDVERSFTKRVRDEGWSAVPADDRQGITDPVAAGPDYRAYLERSFDQHRQIAQADTDNGDAGVDFDRFMDAQLLRDRAMAQAIAEAAARPEKPLVVAIAGGGHAENGFGIPAQLGDLGLTDHAVLLAWERERDCDRLTAETAKWVFGIAPPVEVTEDVKRPLLGVRIGPDELGAKVVGVMPDSVAEAAGIQADDVVTHAAGLEITTTQDLVQIVRRQAWGTWLPLTVRRGDQSMDLVARFPVEE